MTDQNVCYSRISDWVGQQISKLESLLQTPDYRNFLLSSKKRNNMRYKP